MSGELSRLADQVGKDWKSNSYYESSEQHVRGFWSETSPFRMLFDRMTLGTVIDLACGHGKQSQFIVDRCTRLYLVDINSENLDFCRSRYAAHGNVEYVLTSGYDIPSIATGTVDAIFCYDAMVHFAPEVVAAYLRETRRLLRAGGCGLFHHSNLADPPSTEYGRNPHARNRMSIGLFCRMAEDAGLSVIESRSCDWGGVQRLDGLTLVGA